MSDKDIIEDMALVLYDHFNPDHMARVNVGKDVCLKMAELAFRALKARMQHNSQ